MVDKNLQGKQQNIKDLMGEKNIVFVSRKVIALMSKHIGRENAISKRNVFKHFFGLPENFNQYQQTFIWGKLLSVVGYIRRKTKCFVICEHRSSDYYFYVLKGQSDANVYIKQADDRIRGLRGMQARAQKAVSEKWYIKVQDAGKKYALNDKKHIKELTQETK